LRGTGQVTSSPNRQSFSDGEKVVMRKQVFIILVILCLFLILTMWRLALLHWDIHEVFFAAISSFICFASMRELWRRMHSPAYDRLGPAIWERERLPPSVERAQDTALSVKESWRWDDSTAPPERIGISDNVRASILFIRCEEDPRFMEQAAIIRLLLSFPIEFWQRQGGNEQWGG
jgi:hypothetical protein